MIKVKRVKRVRQVSRGLVQKIGMKGASKSALHEKKMPRGVDRQTE